jgi:polysaccharide deacetylase family sporulation protein PdaB
MTFYVIKARRVLPAVLALVIVFAAVYIILMSNSGVLGVFNGNKDLPIYSVESPDKVVSVTFDCAWGADDIPDILNTLKKENVKATFFVLGQWAQKNPEMIKMMAMDGHDTANHSQSHFRMGALNGAKIREEIDLCGRNLSEITGNKIDLFRAPYGDYNNDVVRIARELGYHTIQWDVDSLDWRPGISQEEIMNRIVTKVKPGSIILFHNDTPHTARMLPDIISALKNNGYEFLPVSKMILKDDYFIDFDGTQRRNK